LIHLTLVVFEDTQVDDLIRQRLSICFAILFADGQKHTETAPDRGDKVVANRHLGFRDFLNDGTHSDI
jgi:hypothetical protein